MQVRKRSDAEKILKSFEKACEERGQKSAFAEFSKFSTSYVGRVLKVFKKSGYSAGSPSDIFLDAAERWLVVTNVSRRAPKGPSGAPPAAPKRRSRPKGARGEPPRPVPPPEGLESPGKRLKWARWALGYKTQREMADFLGEKDRAVIANFESGRGAAERILLKIENKMGVSAEWLETGRGDWRIGPASLDIVALEQRIMSGLEPILHTLGMERGAALAALRDVLMGDRPEDLGPEEFGEYFVNAFLRNLPRGGLADTAGERGPAYGYDPLGLMNRIDALDGAALAEVMALVEKLEKERPAQAKAKRRKKN